MQRSRDLLDPTLLREYLFYSPRSGYFFWLKDPPRHPGRRGSVACRLRSDGYRVVSLFGFRFLAHRLAFLYATGQWPDTLIDHADNRKGNNRWGNLRRATRSSNMANSALHPTNTSGLKGVSLHKASGLWRATISKHGKATSLGYFENQRAAAEAYDKAAVSTFGVFAKTNLSLGLLT